MIDPPTIVQTSDQSLARLHLVVPRERIQHEMGPAIGEVMAAIAAQGIAPVGPWFTHHLRRPNTVFDLEVCVPIATPMAAAGRVQPGHWPAMTVARTIHHGGYEGLGTSWGEFLAWIDGKSLRQCEDLYETYLVGPETTADPVAWRTRLDRPLAAPVADDALAIVSTRVFAAPRSRVFHAWTDPVILARWWGPQGFTNTFHVFEPRPGGRWDFIMHGPDGTNYANHSVFVEVAAPERIVFDHVSPPVFRVIATFTDEAPGTRVTFRMQFADRAVLERVAAIVRPANEQNFDRLAAQLL